MKLVSRYVFSISAVAALLFTSVAPAAAQDKPVTFNIGAGVSIPQGDISDRFDLGFTVPVGLTFNINENLGIQGEYSYSFFNGPEATLNLIGGSGALIESEHTMHVGSANLVFSSSKGGPIGGYGIGGVGIYHRSVALTTPAVGLVTVCDPYWFVCYPTPVSVDQVIGSRSTNDFGFNVGGGITFANRFYVEARFHYTFGPEFTAGSTTVKANGYYIPIVAGFRF